MQAVVDRVIRSFTTKHPVALRDPMSDAESKTVCDKATEFATQLLDNYKDQLAQRVPKPD
jgi:hypothetical protein